MAKSPTPLNPAKRVPKTVSKPKETATAAISVVEAAVAPLPRRAAKKTRPAPVPVPVQAVVSEVGEVIVSKTAKAHKPKLVRDSFTIPKEEYQVLDALKKRALGLGQHARKSELLRAGIQALNAMKDRAFLDTLNSVPTLKTGRPKAD